MSKHKGRNTEFARMRRIMARLEHQIALEKEEIAKKKSEKKAGKRVNKEANDMTAGE